MLDQCPPTTRGTPRQRHPKDFRPIGAIEAEMHGLRLKRQELSREIDWLNRTCAARSKSRFPRKVEDTRIKLARLHTLRVERAALNRELTRLWKVVDGRKRYGMSEQEIAVRKQIMRN